MDDNEAWKNAEAHLADIEERYRKLVGMAGVNPFFALGVISTVRARFDKGERTPELYQDIMELE